MLTLTAFILFLVAGANLWQFALLVPAGIAALAVVIVGNAYQASRVTAFLDPWKDPLGAGFHTIQGLLALGLGGVFGAGLGQSTQAGGRGRAQRVQRLHLRRSSARSSGSSAASWWSGLFLIVGYQGIRIALDAPDTFGGLLAAGVTAWLLVQAFINIGVVVDLLPVTGITLPFVSAGGSSLMVSFAAVGILLSISRETVKRGTWNDADPDRRRWNGRAHLPGAGGRPSPARAGPRPLTWRWVGGHRGLGARTGARRRASRSSRLLLRSLRSTDLSIHAVLDPIRLGASVPQALALLTRLRPGGHLHAPAATWPCPCSLAAAAAAHPDAPVGGQRRARPERPRGRPAGDRRALSFEATRRRLRRPRRT